MNKTILGKLGKNEKIIRLNEAGLSPDDPCSWTEENIERFQRHNPGCEVSFEEVQRIIKTHDSCCDCEIERIRLVVLPSGNYSKVISPGFEGVSYSKFILKRGLGDVIAVELPYNAGSLCNTFSASDARRIEIRDQDLRDYKYISGLFSGNESVEEIVFENILYPNAGGSQVRLDQFDCSNIFTGCKNLKKLWLSTPPVNCWFAGDAYIKKNLERCFEGCKNLEYVYLSGQYRDIYISAITKASEKKVTIDGKYDFHDWLSIHGGLGLEISIGSIFRDSEKVCLVEKPGNSDINFVGRIYKRSIEEYENLTKQLMEKEKISKSDYATMRNYIHKIKKEAVI